MNAKSNRRYSLASLTDFFDGNLEAVAEIARMIKIEIPVFLNKLKEETDAGQWQEVYKTAHKFKPATLNLGLPHLKEVLIKIEQNASSETNVEEIPALVNFLQEELMAVHKELQADFS